VFVFEDGVVVFALSRLPVRAQLKSLLFWQFVAFAMVSVIFSNFYISSQELRLKLIAVDDAAEVALLLRIFTFVLPTSFLWAPVVGWLLDARGLVTTLLVVQVSFVVKIILQMIPVPRLQILAFVVYAFWRACFYTVLIALIVRIFGFRTFGTLYGVLAIVLGVVNFVIYGFAELAVVLQSFLLFDLLELVPSVLALAFPVYMAKRSQSMWLRRDDVEKR